MDKDKLDKAQNISDIAKKRQKEQRTVEFMIGIYCHGNHKTKGRELCPECRELAEYARARVEHCPHMETKTFCSSCKTHCYKPEMREKIRKVMKYAGPRMIIYSPKMVIMHLLEGKG